MHAEDGAIADLPAIASARARAAAYRAGKPMIEDGAPRPRRRWPRYVGAVVAGLIAANAVVVVTGWPANRPSLAHLRYLQQGLDATIEASHVEGVSTHLDLLSGRVVIDQAGQRCAPSIGFRSDNPVTLDDWRLIERVPRLPYCQVDI